MAMMGAGAADGSSTDKGAAVLAIAPPINQAGGFETGYVCVRVRTSVLPVQLADGSWTLHRTAAGGDGGEIALAQDERDLQAALTRHHVTTVTRFFGGNFKRPDLAVKYGLDRDCLVHVAPGSDVAALNADLNAARFAQIIESSQLDSIGTLAGIPNDPSFSGQWDMHNTGQSGGTPDADIDAPEAWDIHTGSSSTIVAILDTGVQADHPDLNGKVVSGVDVRGVFGPPPANYGPDTSDLNGHGTHCAGTAGARGNDGVGVAGTNWNTKILAVRVTDPTTGSWNSTDVSEGVIWAVDTGNADVLSMSLQSYSGAMTILENAVAYAYDSGTLPIAAAGNVPSSGAGHVSWPARYAKCMAIAATTNFDLRWFDGSSSGSCDGPEVDVAAPGKNIFNITRLSGYATMTGTSMATPHVAGMAALIMSRNPALTVPQVEAIIKNTAEDKGPAGFDNEYGFGRVNLNAALLAAAPACTGDVDGNHVVNVADLLSVISHWGACPAPPAACPGDVAPTGPPAGDGIVNVADLLQVISHWGACP